MSSLTLQRMPMLSIYFYIFMLENAQGNDTSAINLNENQQHAIDLSNGFGHYIPWWSLEEGFLEAAKLEKPLMIIVHKTGCGACKAFKNIFKDSIEVLDLSRYFVMVNIKQENLKDATMSPDGTYVPRVLFSDSRGNIHYEIFNKRGNPDYKYFYSKMPHLVESMKRAISMFVTLTASDEL